MPAVPCVQRSASAEPPMEESQQYCMCPEHSYTMYAAGFNKLTEL